MAVARYKVSYTALSKQGDELKAVAKLLDQYSEKVGAVRSKLGSDKMLERVRSDLQKLCTQLGECRTALNVAGDILGKSVQRYTKNEQALVKKVDGAKAHNHDFYKNPVVVASVGGAAVATGTAGAATATASGGGNATVNYTENNIYNISTGADQAAAAAGAAKADMSSGAAVDGIKAAGAPGFDGGAASTPAPMPTPTPAAATAAAPADSGGAPIAGIVGGSVAGIAAAAAGVVGGKKLVDKIKQNKEKKAFDEFNASLPNDMAELEAMLADARERAKKSEERGDG